MKTYAQLRKLLLKDEEIKKAYDAFGPEFELVHMLLQKRIESGFTQAELAKKIGTKQSAISRLESGSYNPTLALLRKVAEALGSDIEISLR